MSVIIIITPPPTKPGDPNARTDDGSRNADAVTYVEGETAKRLIDKAVGDGSRIRVVTD